MYVKKFDKHSLVGIRMMLGDCPTGAVIFGDAPFLSCIKEMMSIKNQIPILIPTIDGKRKLSFDKPFLLIYKVINRYIEPRSAIVFAYLALGEDHFFNNDTTYESCECEIKLFSRSFPCIIGDFCIDIVKEGGIMWYWKMFKKFVTNDDRRFPLWI